MKKYIIFLTLIAAFIAAPAFAAPTLVWEFTQTENIATGFKVYSQEATAEATVYSQIVPGGADVREFPIDVTMYEPGKTYIFWMTAFNSAGESQPSNTAEYIREAYVPTENPPPAIYITIPPSAPVSITIGR